MMIAEQYFSIHSDQLPIGGVAAHSLLDQTGNVILEGNAAVTQDFFYELKRAHIKHVFVHCEDRQSWGLAATAGRPLQSTPAGSAAPFAAIRRVSFDPRKITKARQPIVDCVEGEIRRFRASPGGAHSQPPHAVVVRVMPVNDRLAPVDDPFEGVLRELTCQGAVLFHSRAISAKFLVMELAGPNGKSLQLVVELQDRQLFGRFYELRGKLVAKLD